VSARQKINNKSSFLLFLTAGGGGYRATSPDAGIGRQRGRVTETVEIAKGLAGAIACHQAVPGRVPLIATGA